MSICEYVNDIVEVFNKSSIQNKKVTIRDENNNTYELPFNNYIYHMNSTIQVMANMEYLETIFELNEASKTSCTGKIHLKVEDVVDIFTSSNILLYLSKIYGRIDGDSETSIMGIFSKECYKRIEDTACKYGNNLTFTSIALSTHYVVIQNKEKVNKSHENMLLILKIKENESTDIIKFYLYEPHGYDDKRQSQTIINFASINNIFISQLIKHLEKQYNKNLSSTSKVKFQVVDKKSISCPVGIQSYVNDRLGYCKLVSALWIYVIVKIMRTDFVLTDSQKIYLFDNLNIIEECLEKHPRLYDILVNFSSDLVNIYISKTLQKNGGETFLQKLNIRVLKYYQTQVRLDELKIPTITREEEPIKEEDLSDDEEQQEQQKEQVQDKKIFKNISDLSRLYKRKVKFNKGDCASCVKNEECKSNYCEKRKCKPRMIQYANDPENPKRYRIKPSKCEGEICKNNYQCYSEYCSSKKIILEDGHMKEIDEGKKVCRKLR